MLNSPTVFVIYHKPSEIYNLPSNYKKIQIGKNCKVERKQILYVDKTINVNDPFFTLMDYYDDTGNNISDITAWISEYSAIYWVWKNLKFNTDDYIGFCHYRRISFYPPDYKNYDIIQLNYSYDYIWDINDSLLNTWIKTEIKQDYDTIIKILNINSEKDYYNMLEFVKIPLKHVNFKEMFLMKWNVFNIFCSRLNSLHNILWKFKDEIKYYAHIIEFLIAYLIWDLSRQYKSKACIEYILPNTERLLYRNGNI